VAALVLVSLFLVDNQEFVRDALAQLPSASGLDVVGGGSLGEHCLQSVVDLRPDVVLVEPFLNGTVNGGAGLEWVRRLAEAAPTSRILVLTGLQGHQPVVDAILAGACGYLLKEAPPEEIAGAVRASAAGDGVICPREAGELRDCIRTGEVRVGAGTGGAATAIRATLTQRELEILERLASGKTNQQIGREVSLSEHTVKNHVASILEKLDLDNRIQAAVQAVRSGIV
jgi:DNA-binding NarL/FixJ family response regulator